MSVQHSVVSTETVQLVKTVYVPIFEDSVHLAGRLRIWQAELGSGRLIVEQEG